MVAQTLERTVQMFGVSHGYVLLETPGLEAVYQSGAKGFSALARTRLSSPPLRAYLALSADRWGNLMVFPDLRRPDLGVAWQRDRDFEQFRNVLAAEGVRTLVTVGLQIKERSYGALLVGSRSPRVFKRGELGLILAVGNQVSVAVENRYLRKASERHDEELKTLHRVAEALRATFDLQTQVQILPRELASLIGSQKFSLALQDSPGGRLETLVAMENGSSEGSHTSASDNGLADYVVRTRAPLLIAEDLPGVSHRLGISSVDPRIRTWCGVPIRFSDGSMGVLAVADMERERSLDEKKFQLLQVLADEAAVAIENARLFQREYRRTRHLTLLNELGRKAMSILDPLELLPKICEQVRAAFGYERVRIERLDRERNELVVEAQEGYGEEVVGRRLQLGKGLSGVAAETGEPAFSNSVDKDDRYVALDARVRSTLNLPLKYRDEILGVLTIESHREHNFSQQDVLTLRALADVFAIALSNARAYQAAQEQAVTDSLTGLKTHRYFMEALESEWRRATRSGHSFSVIMMDLDGFKQVNDRRGHLEGDKVLMAVARLLKARLRQFNVVARYGGDEFAILMPEATSDQAEILAERLRSTLAPDPYLASHKVTASLGIASFPTHGASPEEILRVADLGMYLAKRDKGNRVRVAPVTPQASAEPEKQVLEAYLGVTVKRMFSTGPEAFEQYLQRFERATQDPNGEAPSLLDTVAALAFTIDAKDPYTRGHSHSVSRLAAQIANQLGLPEPEVEEIRLAGILHDIGKIGVPESVLNKPTRLTEEEYLIMKGHAAQGDRILEPLKVKTIERIRPMVRHHHEWMNGSGYPDRLKGEDIPLGARILTVADAFDSMVSERAYQKGRTAREAVEELRRCCGTQFDEELVEAFVQSLKTLGDPRLRTIFEKVAG
jgi:diguanylate cyclase (GGDEF)-like protein/putative nucleotidyltransferase with HDIG domain